MQKYRKKQVVVNHERKEERKALLLQELQEQRELLRQEKIAELEKKAKKGDKLACMMLALKQNGLISLEYWQAYAEYEKERAESRGRTENSFVNEISVNDEEFALKVVVTIQELGHIRHESHIGEKINANYQM